MSDSIKMSRCLRNKTLKPIWNWNKEGLIGTIIVSKKEVLNDFSSTNNHRYISLIPELELQNKSISFVHVKYSSDFFNKNIKVLYTFYTVY